MFLDKKSLSFFHEWKLILLYLIDIAINNAVLHLNFIRIYSFKVINCNKTKFYPSFYREIILKWKKKHLAMITEIPSCVLSRYLLYKDSTQVEKASVNFLKFSKKSIDYVSQRLGDNGSIKN